MHIKFGTLTSPMRNLLIRRSKKFSARVVKRFKERSIMDTLIKKQRKPRADKGQKRAPYKLRKPKQEVQPQEPVVTNTREFTAVPIEVKEAPKSGPLAELVEAISQEETLGS